MALLNIPLRKDVDIVIVPSGTELALPEGSVIIPEVQLRHVTATTRYIDPATGEQSRFPGSLPGQIAESKLTIRTDWKEAERGR